ncbi:MAG: hypothetical protein RR331_10430 [Bacteroides sp.]
MKTEILDNYIEVTTGAINWVMLWINHQVTPHVLKWHGITKGEELEQRLSELSTKSIETEIYENSTPTDLRDYALVFCNKLNGKGALFKFKFEDRSFNYEREYIECIDNLLGKATTFTLAPCAEKSNARKIPYWSCPYNFKFRKFRHKRPALITEDEAKAIASCIDNIVTYVYQNSEELIKIFKGLGLKERADNGANAESETNGAEKSVNVQQYIQDSMIGKIYNKCNGLQWEIITLIEFKQLVRIGDGNIAVMKGEKKKTVALFYRMSMLIKDVEERGIWSRNISSILGVDRINKYPVLDEVDSSPNKMFNLFLQEILKLPLRG